MSSWYTPEISLLYLCINWLPFHWFSVMEPTTNDKVRTKLISGCWRGYFLKLCNLVWFSEITQVSLINRGGWLVAMVTGKFSHHSSGSWKTKGRSYWQEPSLSIILYWQGQSLSIILYWQGPCQLLSPNFN